MASSNLRQPRAWDYAGCPTTPHTQHRTRANGPTEPDLREYITRFEETEDYQDHPRRAPLLPTPTTHHSQQPGLQTAVTDSPPILDDNRNDLTSLRTSAIPPTSWGRNFLVSTRHADQPLLSIHCVAIVDCQSCSSYVSEELVHLLRVPSSPCEYWVEAVGGSTHMPKGRVVQGLQICRAGTRDWFDLPPVLTTPSLPHTTSDMATKEIVERFPHIAPFAHNFPQKVDKTTPTWLLLGRNCNTAMTTQTFGEISPQVHHGRLGWAMVGSEESPQFKYHELEPQPPFVPRYVERSNEVSYSGGPASSEQSFPQHSGHFQAAASTVQSQAAEVPVHTSAHPELIHNPSIKQWQYTQDPGHLQAASSFLAAEVSTQGPPNSTSNCHSDRTPLTPPSSQFNPSSNIKAKKKTHRAGVKHRKYNNNLKRRALASVLTSQTDDQGGDLNHPDDANEKDLTNGSTSTDPTSSPQELTRFVDSSLSEATGALALAPTIPDNLTLDFGATSPSPPSASVKVLIMGSSHVCKLEHYVTAKTLQLHQHEVEFKFDGHSGASFRTYIDSPHLMTSALKFQPHIVVVILGGNSITKQATEHQIRMDCHNFYRALQAAVPIHVKILGAEVFMRRLWSSDRTPTPPDFERSRDSLNNCIRTLLHADDIIELTGKTSLDYHGATYDGVHLRPPALGLLWTKIVKAVSEVLKPQRKSVSFQDSS